MTPCIRFGSAIVCGPDVYKFEGWTFEVHSYLGPYPLKKNGDPYVHIPEAFWDVHRRWEKAEDREQYRVV